MFAFGGREEGKRGAKKFLVNAFLVVVVVAISFSSRTQRLILHLLLPFQKEGKIPFGPLPPSFI